MITKLNDWQTDVLKFWFEELNPKSWFICSDELDATIMKRFGDVHRKLRESNALEHPINAHSVLASVIVLDQFSRNMFRGTAEAFKYDELALSFAKQACKAGLDKTLEGNRLKFLCMPFSHSEDMQDQDIAVALLGGDANSSAVKHREIIRRFGRFPHRNEVLSRRSTAEERIYLEKAKRFGQ